MTNLTNVIPSYFKSHFCLNFGIQPAKFSLDFDNTSSSSVLYHRLNRSRARSHDFILLRASSFKCPLGINTRSTSRNFTNSSFDFQMPTFRPAKKPAPRTLTSVFLGRSTSKPVKSANS